MNSNELSEKQADLQQQALAILASIPDMEKNGSSQAEIDDKIAEANRLTEESETISNGLKAASDEKSRKIKKQIIMIAVSLLVAVIAMQFIR